MTQNIEANQKIYFGRGPLEFVGQVLAFDGKVVTAKGVEPGCLAKEVRQVSISYLEGIQVLTDTEWQQRIRHEPAFASEISSDTFLALQREIESLEMSVAMGQETESTDQAIKVIEAVMNDSPWDLCMDTGRVISKEAIAPKNARAAHAGPRY